MASAFHGFARRSLAMAVFLFSAALSKPAATAQEVPKTKPLSIYFIDVEGGQATLVVTPKGKSLLIDTGWPGDLSRDADRIVAAARNAGVAKIDFVLLTHYHTDHAGGVPQLAGRIPIGTFIDHGPSIETTGSTAKIYADYQQVLAGGKSKHLVARPGAQRLERDLGSRRHTARVASHRQLGVMRAASEHAHARRRGRRRR